MTETLVKSFYDIPGWFRWLDMTVFEALLQAQSSAEPGVLVELGTYLGKSAVIIGNHVRAGERFVALDLFGNTDILSDSPQDHANRRESLKSYKTLTRQQFENNYLALHPELPTIVQGLSSEIVQHVEPGSARFVHVDASHVYAHVRVDAVNTKSLLRPNGIAVFDDFRSEHTPGVSAAVWEAVFRDGLIPLLLTTQKFYGVYAEPEPYYSVLRDLFASDARYRWEEQEIAGRKVLRASMVPQQARPANMPGIDVDQLATSLADKVAPLLIKKLPKPPKIRPAPAPTPLSTQVWDAAPAALKRWVRHRMSATGPVRPGSNGRHRPTR